MELISQTDAFSSSRREVRWAQMRLAKDWDCMISGIEYGTYRGPVHYVVRAYMMALIGLHPPWSSCKNQAMQLQLLALPSNSTEGSMTFWVPFFSLVTNRWTSTIFFCCHLATTYCKSTDMSSLFIFPVHYAHECMMSELWSILKWLFCLCSELGASTNWLRMLRRHVNMLSAKSPQELQGMVWLPPQMEFVCCIWANPRGSRIPFSLDVCKALDERTLCVSTLILSCVYAWGQVHVVCFGDWLFVNKDLLCDSSILQAFCNVL